MGEDEEKAGHVGTTVFLIIKSISVLSSVLHSYSSAVSAYYVPLCLEKKETDLSPIR